MLALITIGGFLAGPLVLRHLAEQRLGRVLGRTVTIERLEVNPFALSVTAERLSVREEDGRTPFLSIPRLYVNAELASVLRRALIVREIRVESPRIRVERRQTAANAGSEGLAYNFSDLLARLAALSETAPTGGGVLPRFSLNNIRIVDGSLTFIDVPLHRRHEITSFSLGIPFISTLPVDIDTFVEPGMSGRVDGTPFAIRGHTKPFEDTLQTVVELRLHAVDLVPYLPYVPLPLNATVTSAQLTAAVDISFARPPREAPMLSLHGMVALGNVSLRERGIGGRTLLDLRSLAVAVANLDIPNRRFFVDQVSVSGLDVYLRRTTGGKLSFAGLLPETAQRPATEGRRASPSDSAGKVRFSVRDIRIENSTLRFRDEAVRPPFEASVDDISVSVEHLSNAPGSEATMTATLRARPGGTISESGRFSLDPLASSGTVSVEGIDLRRFAAYYRDDIAFEVVRGGLRLGARYEVADERDHVSLHLREGAGDVKDLVLRWPRARSELLRMPELAVRGVDADFDGRLFSFAEVSSRDGLLRIRRDEHGVVDLTTLVASPSSPAWTVGVARLDVEGWNVRLEDHAVSPPAVMTARPLSLHATSLSTALGSRSNVELRTGLNKQGRVALAGSVGFEPPLADLRVDLRTVELAPLQSYFRDRVNLTVTDGLVSFKGQVRAELPRDGTGASRGRPSPDPRVRLVGDVDVANFAAVDPEKKEELLRCRAFHVSDLKVSTTPIGVVARDVALADFGASLVISTDGHFNLQDALGRSGPTTSTPPKISIEEVDLTRGQIRFTDRSIHPSFSTELTALAGRATGLSSSPGTRASVDLHGRLAPSGLVAISGTLNPLEEDLSLDMKGEAKDLELPPASPYAIKYLGHGIEKGTLSLAVTYHVAQKKLDARNRVVLKQLALGEKVPGPDAVSLPIKLAVALLKDRDGVIDVDVPLSGALDDPHFELAGLFWKALGGQVLKATEAPFPLIAKAFGGGGELSRVAFPAGLATLDGGERAKLETLAKALKARPELAFEIQGGTDPQRDRDGLRRDRFERKLMAQKLAELARAGAPAGATREVRPDPQDRPRLLAAAYKAETFPKPRNLFGFAKSISAEEMEKLMLAHIEISDEDLRALALRRASAVRESLAKLAPAATHRLFLVDPRLGRGATRVDLKLKID